jgi:hypothetical protein
MPMTPRLPYYPIYYARALKGKFVDAHPSILTAIVLDGMHFIPISHNRDCKDSRNKVLLRPSDADFIFTNLDQLDQYALGDECHNIPPHLHRGRYVGRIQGDFLKKINRMMGFDDDSSFIEHRTIKRNPSWSMIEDFKPWLVDMYPEQFIALTKEEAREYAAYEKLTVWVRLKHRGMAVFDAKSKKILLPAGGWPDWHNWVHARSLALYACGMSKKHLKEWGDILDANPSAVYSLIYPYISLKGGRLSDVAAGALAEAMYLHYAEMDDQHLPRDIVNFVVEVGEPVFRPK